MLVRMTASSEKWAGLGEDTMVVAGTGENQESNATCGRRRANESIARLPSCSRDRAERASSSSSTPKDDAVRYYSHSASRAHRAHGQR